VSLRGRHQHDIPSIAQLEGSFLESTLPARAFATLTTRVRISRQLLDESFSEWIRGVQAHNRVTVGWIKSIELTPQRHIHSVLVASSPLDCYHAAALWQIIASPRYDNAARVAPFQHGLCGFDYILKQLGHRMEEIQFSENLPAFAPGNHFSQFRTTSAERRQHRRIKEQIQTKSSCSFS
jgi:hypothetical protein